MARLGASHSDPVPPPSSGESLDRLFERAASFDASVESVLDLALEEAVRTLAADAGGVAVAHPHGEREQATSVCIVRGQLKRPWLENTGQVQMLLLSPRRDRSLTFCENANGFLNVPLAIEGRRLGALQIETSRPAFAAAIKHRVDELAEAAALLIERIAMRECARRQGLNVYFIGRSPGLLALERQIRRVARDPKRPVLIRGERGVGKELVAYAVHYFSARRDRPFVPVNSAAFSDSLFIDELFGHQRHSFTGASTSREGMFKAAEGGTLFFDEIGDMPPAVQAALLRVLDQGEYRAVGADRTSRADVRILAATNRDLSTITAESGFRADLLDRLNVYSLRVPALRGRREDIPLLFCAYFKESCAENGRRHTSRDPGRCEACLKAWRAACVEPTLLRRLAEHEFPGNIRELRNVAFRLSTLVANAIVRPEDANDELASLAMSSNGNSREQDLLLDSAVRAHISKVLEMSGNNKSKAARVLGLPLTTLVNKMKRLSMG